MPSLKRDRHEPMPRDERGWRMAPAPDGRGMPDSPAPKPYCWSSGEQPAAAGSPADDADRFFRPTPTRTGAP